MAQKKVLTGKRVGVLGKGGSGKSTVVVLLAKALVKQGYQVSVLDADSTNIGLHQALGFENPPVSLMKYFGGTEFSGGLVSCPVDNPTLLPGAEIDVNKIPNQYYLQKGDLFLFTAGKIGDKGPGAGCDGPISKITRDLRVKGVGDHPVTLIDVKAGLEDSARGIITTMDWVVVVVDPSLASVQMAEDVKNLIKRIKQGELPATEHLESAALVKRANQLYRKAKIKGSFALLNKIKNGKVENYLKEELGIRDIKPIGIIHEDSSISLSWLQGKPLKSKRVQKEIMATTKKLKKAIQGYEEP